VLERKRCKDCAPGETLRRSAPKARQRPKEPKPRKALPAMSKRRAGQVEARREVDRLVIDRDRICVAASWGAPGVCMGELHAHELEKRSQRRDAHLDPENCVAVCNFHNGWVEDNPREAHRLGLVIRRGDAGSTR
jgi:hypothetical protein